MKKSEVCELIEGRCADLKIELEEAGAPLEYIQYFHAMANDFKKMGREERTREEGDEK